MLYYLIMFAALLKIKLFQNLSEKYFYVEKCFQVFLPSKLTSLATARLNEDDIVPEPILYFEMICSKTKML